MNSEIFISLPDGKTELPARLIINKMGSSIHLDLKAELKTDLCDCGNHYSDKNTPWYQCSNCGKPIVK